MIIVGTRGSKLALKQTEDVIGLLRGKEKNCEFIIKEIKTTGDSARNKRFTEIGGIGVFVKEIENALIKKDIDIAVHSMKDLPVDIPDNLTISAVTKREDNSDCLISRKGEKLNSLPKGACIGTSSIRRKFQLLNFRSDFCIKELRGNLDTRLKKLYNGLYDAIVVSLAGLKRLNMFHLVTEIIPYEIMLPAAGQGAIAIETRKDDKEIIKLVKKINDKDTELVIKAERSFLRAIGGGCHVPIGAYGYVKSEKLYLEAEVFLACAIGYSNRVRKSLCGKKEEASEIGIKLASTIQFR